MSDDLVKRLRTSAGIDDVHDAADLIEAQSAEIARLCAACDASEDRERAIELRFWQTVDRDGLTGLPSDMWAALEQLTQDRAALATARREGMEEAAQDLEGRAKMLRSFDPDSVSAHWAWHYAAAIRAALEEGKDE